jgi:hypothetical protein
MTELATTEPRSDHPDAAHSRVRAALASVERGLPSQDPALRRSFDALVTELGLGAEPAVRECPRCHKLGFAAATLCGHCWTKLTP